MPRALPALALALTPALAPAPAAGQTVTPCGDRADSRHIIEPWEDHTRTFAEGAVRLTVLDLVDPAAGPIHLMVLTPPYTVAGWAPGLGFASLGFGGMIPTYDPTTGLTLAMPARFYDPALEFSNIGVLQVTIDQSSGGVAAAFSITGSD